MGALAVVQNVADTDWINRRLRALDERLFVEKQLTFRDEEVWCVVEDTGEAYGAERFVCVLEWRDGNGRPLPYLSDGIIDELQRRRREGVTDAVEAGKIAQRRNHDRKERQRKETDEHYHDISTDFENHRAIGNFMIVPRSRALARTRARVRSQTVEQRLAEREAKRIAKAFGRP